MGGGVEGSEEGVKKRMCMLKGCECVIGVAGGSHKTAREKTDEELEK